MQKLLGAQLGHLFIWELKGQVNKATLFLHMPPGDSLPVLTAHSLASNLQLAFFKSEEKKSP